MTMLGWKKGEVPPFTFCEGVKAVTLGPWHIRRVNPGIGLKFSGGIDTTSLCGQIKRGWDLNVRIEEGHLEHTCPECVEKYRAATKS
jgi:hypothetical protein